jgi:hypothetical protein
MAVSCEGEITGVVGLGFTVMVTGFEDWLQTVLRRVKVPDCVTVILISFGLAGGGVPCHVNPDVRLEVKTTDPP